MALNRFTKSGQLNEEAFVGLLYDYVMGTSATVCAARTGVHVDTVNKKFLEFSSRILTDPKIGRYLTDLPVKDDVIWDKIEKCIFGCPLNREFASVEVKRARSMHRPEVKSSLRSSTWKRRPAGQHCSDCELGQQELALPHHVLETLFNQRQLSKQWNKSEFRGHLIRSIIIVAATTNAIGLNRSPHSIVKALLDSFERNPL